ncbi:MAG: histidine kinase [Flavobacteriaceae bacterium]|nr:histidine kinase [Flavobacteriaceae bacterium]|tara:strand:+ start:1022 stop:1480 length:459 start_codon:yes stop_codon:yes gene_type:complete
MYKIAIDIIGNEIKSSNDLINCLNNICKFLNQKIKGYDWVGFYFHNEKNKELELIAFSGLPTQHTKIPFGKGICGTSALTNNPIVVDDVSKESNYISCNINVKSEIVVPLFANNKNVGQIDIDSNSIGQFKKIDLNFLIKINQMISKKFFKL